MKELKLISVTAYTVNSADNEMRSSDKGTYKDYNTARVDAMGSGWYGSDGTVKIKEDVYQDENKELYIVKHIGKFTDEEAKYKNDLMASIKSKLTEAELKLLNL